MEITFHPITLISSLLHLLLLFLYSVLRGRSSKLGNWKGLLDLGKCKYSPFWLLSGFGGGGDCKGGHIRLEVCRFLPQKILSPSLCWETTAAIVRQTTPAAKTTSREQPWCSGHWETRCFHARWAYYHKSTSIWEGPTTWKEKQQTQWMKGPVSEETREQSKMYLCIHILGLW